MERTGEKFAEGQPEDKLKEEYRAIAERRVRLGLILSDIGQNNQLKVEQHELNAVIAEQARRYPGQEQKVFDFFRKNPSASEHLRAPLYEDKVVDFILQLATVTERQVTPDELMADPDTDPAGEAAASAAAAAVKEAETTPPAEE
jgi:trigger factor